MRVSATLMAAVILAAPAFADKKAKGPVYEPDTYRFGGTYSTVASQSATQCATSCKQDRYCIAWSYLDLPGPHSQNACELKSTIGKAENNPSATSGISARIEKYYQPSPYHTQTVATRTTSTVHTSQPAPSNHAKHTRVYRTAPAAPATVTTGRTVTRSAPPAPRRAPVKSPLYKTPPTQPLPSNDRTYPISTARPSAPAAKPAPSVQFAPLQTNPDGSYRPAPADVALSSDMTGASAGGVGETPAAPISRNAAVNAQGERMPYKDLSAREYPDYSVTRAAEQGAVDPVGTEDPSTSLPVGGH